MESQIMPLQEKSYPPLIKLDKEICRLQKAKLLMLNKIDKDDISLLWENLTLAFGNKFTGNFGYSDSGVWYETLMGFTKLEVSLGFKTMLKSFTQQERDKKEVWPPNVKELYLYCLSAFKTFNIPDVREAYNECQSHLNNRTLFWSHPVLFYSMLYMGADVIKDDFWCHKVLEFKNYYLLMSKLFIEDMLPKIPKSTVQIELMHKCSSGNRTIAKNIKC